MKNSKFFYSTIMLCALILTGCKQGSYEVDKWDEQVDTNRTQIYVHNYEGGFGSEWLKNAKMEYEKIHAEEEYEPGKKGVQIMIKADKNTFQPSSLKISSYDLFFLQESKAYSFYKAGAIEDIDEAITGDNPYEPGVTIESKLTDAQKDFFKEDGKYYGLSHYVGSWGLSFNKTIFDQQGFYFVRNHQNKEGELKFIRSYDDFDPADPNSVPKSLGRDGVEGTSDDGLPETYQDFYDLCDFIASYNYTPFTFSSKQKDTYVTSFVNALFMDALGIDEANKLYNYGLNGVTFNNLIKIDTAANSNKGLVIKSGEEYAKENGVLVSDQLGNGYEIYRNEKYLQVLKFMETILTTKKDNDSSSPKYFPKEIITGGATYDYQSAQRSMVQSSSKTTMIIEGQWWENEAKPIASKFGTSYDFSWMPLPRNSREEKHNNVYVDTMDCVAVVRKGTTKRSIALDFIQFVSTKENLINFTKTTNAVKGLDYNFTSQEEVDELKQSLTNFGKTVLEYRLNSDLLLSDSKNEQFQKNLYANNAYRRYYSTYAEMPITALMKNWTSGGVTAEEYFAGTYTHYKNTWVAK